MGESVWLKAIRSHGNIKLQASVALRRARTYVDELMVVSLLQVMQYGGVVQVCQVGHILAFLVLGGVDLGDEVLLEILALRA